MSPAYYLKDFVRSLSLKGKFKPRHTISGTLFDHCL